MKLPAGAPPVATRYPSAYKVKSEHDPKYTATPQTTPRYPSTQRPGEEVAKAAEAGTPLPGSSPVSPVAAGTGVPTTSGPGPAVGGQLAPQAQKAAVAGSMLGPVGGAAGWARTGEARTFMSPQKSKSGDDADFAPIDEGKPAGGAEEKKWQGHEKPPQLSEEQWDLFLKTGSIHGTAEEAQPPPGQVGPGGTYPTPLGTPHDPYQDPADRLFSTEGGVPDEVMKAWEDQTRESHAKQARHEQYLQQMMANQMGFGTSGGAVFQQGVTGMKAAMAAEELIADKWMENEKTKIETYQNELQMALADAQAKGKNELAREIQAKIQDANDQERFVNFLVYAPQLWGQFLQAEGLSAESSAEFADAMAGCQGGEDEFACMIDVVGDLKRDPATGELVYLPPGAPGNPKEGSEGENSSDFDYGKVWKDDYGHVNIGDTGVQKLYAKSQSAENPTKWGDESQWLSDEDWAAMTPEERFRFMIERHHAGQESLKNL